MRLELELTDGQMAELVAAVAERMVADDAVVSALERLRPLSVTEVARVLGVSERMVRHEVEAGRLQRVPNTGRVLIPVEHVQEWQRGKM